MVGFIVGNSDPSSPILTSEDMPQSQERLNGDVTADPAGAGTSGTPGTSGTRGASGTSGSPQPLIPGLPDDMAVKCLARVPFWFHARLKAVSRGWRGMYSSPELLSLRQKEGSQEEYLLCLDSNPSVCQGQLYNPQSGKWRKIPPTPVELHSYGLESFGVVAARHHVFLIGGVLYDARSYPSDFPVASSSVYRFDLVANKWATVASMIEGRGGAACAAAVLPAAQGAASGAKLSGWSAGPPSPSTKIYVAGGDGRYASTQRRWAHLSSAEVYHVEEDEWTPLPPMSSYRTGSSAVVAGDKFAVFGGYGTPRMIAGFLQVSEQRLDSEVYSPTTDKWAWRRLAWFPEDRDCSGPVAQVGGDVFMLVGPTLLRLDLSCGIWCHEATLDWSDRDASFFGMNGEVHVVPSEKVSGKFQKHYAYDPRSKEWTASKLRQRMRYLRENQACRQPFRAVTKLLL